VVKDFLTKKILLELVNGHETIGLPGDRLNKAASK
jgi:hypothetical protein